jgi:hypothetical protein
MVRHHHHRHRCRCRRRCHHCRHGLHDCRGLSVCERDGEPVSTGTRNSAWRFIPHTNPKTRSIQANGSWRGRWKHAYLTAEWQSEHAKPVCARPRGGEARAHTGRERGSKHITFGTNKHTVRQQGDARCQAAVRKGHSTRGLECEFWAIYSRRRTCCIRSRPDALLHRSVMAMP